uniref:NADH-ubiquinone oxidoreductase chain 2 n=1 Tax=Cypridina dentata TaxID=1483471 RepID=A0A4D6TL38_9CRUS|nr:NADH dehydrogenase subunit 2 [Cypridina dentata]QCG82512.1 NADH dehydrogenase subunit 2 [Cypridina dentata]
MKASKALFTTTLITGTLMTLSSPSWFSAWMGLEINLLSFIPLLMQTSPQSTESAMKYFFIQAMGSMIIMFMIITPMLMQSNTMLMCALAIKLGAAPFHFWLPHAIKGLSWVNAATLLSWQKMAPLSLMTFTKNSPAMLILIMASALMGAWGGINELRIKPLLAYSSMNHIAWLTTLSMTSMTTTAFYLMTYTTLMFTMFSILHKTNHMAQMWATPRNSLTTMLSLTILSLGGLPPLTGFLPKWMALNQIITFSKPIAIMLVISSTFLLYYYLRITWISLAQSKTTHIHSPTITSKTWIPIIISTASLPVMSAWILF